MGWLSFPSLLLRNGVTNAVRSGYGLGTTQGWLIGTGRCTGKKDRPVPIKLNEPHPDPMQPLDRGEGDEAVWSRDDDTVDRAVGATKAMRGHALRDWRHRAHMVRCHRTWAVRNDEASAVNTDAGVVSR